MNTHSKPTAVVNSKPSWRDVLPIHPAAELFPRIASEIAALAADIKKNGLKQPIVLWRADDKAQPQLLDGRNRLDAIEMAMGELCIRRWAGMVLIEDSTHLRFDAREIEGDPYAYVVSVNIHRRHLNAEQKRELITKLIKATPEKSDRQIAETVKADHKTVGAVRAEEEARGEIPHVATRTDSKGRKQPAAKPVRARGPTHVCWQCGQRGKVGEVQQHHYAYYEDVWLHDACVGAFDQAEQQREAAAERINALMDGKTEPPVDIGPTSNGENARLRARNEELENENQRLQRENIALRSEIEELRAQLPPDNPGPVPTSLRREAAP
jgi:ParB-like nuclease family protein